MSRNHILRQVVIFLFCTAALLTAATSSGQEKHRHRVSLSVEVSVKKDSKKEKESRLDQNGNTVTTTTDTRTDDCAVTIEVENESDHSGTYELVTALLSRKAGADKPDISDVFRKNITIAGGGVFNDTVRKQLLFTDKVVDYSGWDSRRTRAGETYEGYIVFVKADGEILAQESSSSRFLKEEWISRCEASAPKPAVRKK